MRRNRRSDIPAPYETEPTTRPIQFCGGPHPQDWYGTLDTLDTLDAIVCGCLDPMPSVGKIITLDEIPNALDLARKSDGPPRIVVHPNGDIS
jgi:hypothetical protein